ncbi:hypothetical protein J6590_088751 [Homalodisca vitripennis]|nr:hypothetical protein J6590_088751 [Homalodisca vitripennis]
MDPPVLVTCALVMTALGVQWIRLHDTRHPYTYCANIYMSHVVDHGCTTPDTRHPYTYCANIYMSHVVDHGCTTPDTRIHIALIFICHM